MVIVPNTRVVLQRSKLLSIYGRVFGLFIEGWVGRRQGQESAQKGGFLIFGHGYGPRSRVYYRESASGNYSDL